MAALPGVDEDPSVSSLRLTADSHPQDANTPSSRAEVNAAPPAPKGLSQENSGVVPSNELSPDNALNRAMPAKASRASTCAMISTSCTCADSSVPITQIAVISRMSATVMARTAMTLSARSSAPMASRKYLTPTSASDPTTSTPVMPIAHPAIQPNHGPIARVTQENVVPQSESTRLR